MPLDGVVTSNALVQELCFNVKSVAPVQAHARIDTFCLGHPAGI